MMFIRFHFWLILVLAIGLLPTERVAAQKLKGDAVYLKNGSVIIGKITLNDSVLGIRIVNDCGIWLITPAEYDSIGIHQDTKYFKAKSKGFYNISTFGLLIGKGTYDNTPVPSFTTVNGYKFNSGFTCGIGTGYEYFDWSVLPLFADFRYYVLNEGFSPYIKAQAGYAFSIGKAASDNWYYSIKETFGGPMLSIGAGIRAGFSRNSALLIGISYRFQELSYDEINYWESGTQRRVYTNFNRISFTVGFLFE